MLTVDFATRQTHTPAHCHKNINAYLPVPANPPPPPSTHAPLALPALSTDSVVWLRLTSLGRKLTISLKLHKYLRARAPLFYGKLHSRIWVCATVCECLTYVCLCLCVIVCVCRHVIKTFGSLRYQRVLWLVFSRNPLEKGQQKTKAECKKATRKINKI